jgi:serine/threonine protein kinase
LLGQWKPSDRSSEVISHSPSVDHLSDIFGDFLKNPDRLNSDEYRLLSSFDQLKTATIIPAISNSSAVEWIPNEIGSGDSSVVKLSLDSKSQSYLNAVKTSLNPKCAEFIRREASILETLKHPLILELRHHISDTPEHNSVIVTEFAGNGSLANHLQPTKCRLSGANRITKIVVGIALAMRYLHSRNVIHRDLKPDNILLDWDWTVRIADFGHSISPEKPDIPSLLRTNPTGMWPSIDSHYLAPECYDNKYYEESDVFSFGLILYELLVGQPAFPKELTNHQIAHRLIMTDKWPIIPESILQSTRELINDCWAKEPGYRLSSKEVVDRLEKMKFKVIPGVNSSKISNFVKSIKEFEVHNATVQQ